MQISVDKGFSYRQVMKITTVRLHLAPKYIQTPLLYLILHYQKLR